MDPRSASSQENPSLVPGPRVPRPIPPGPCGPEGDPRRPVRAIGEREEIVNDTPRTGPRRSGWAALACLARRSGRPWVAGSVGLRLGGPVMEMALRRPSGWHGRGRIGELSPSPRACSVGGSSADGAGSWAHRSAVARQVAGWGVHAIASLSDGCKGGCRLARWSFARTSLALGDAASLPGDQACVRGHWSQGPRSFRPPAEPPHRSATLAVDPLGRERARWRGEAARRRGGRSDRVHRLARSGPSALPRACRHG